MSFKSDEPLDREEMKQFFADLSGYMRWQARKNVDSTEKSSMMKEYYGDSWSLVFGIVKGINLMEQDKHKDITWDGPEKEEVSVSVSEPKEWNEHYDEFGYGDYGEGLEIGRRISTYTGSEFEFVENVQDDDEEPKFTFTHGEDE